MYICIIRIIKSRYMYLYRNKQNAFGAADA